MFATLLVIMLYTCAVFSIYIDIQIYNMSEAEYFCVHVIQ